MRSEFPDSFGGEGWLFIDCASCRQLAAFWVGDDEGLAVFYQRRRCCDRCLMGIRIDTETQRVFVDGREVHLQPKEYELLSALMERPGVPFPINRLLSKVWADADVYDQVVYASIHDLRRKLGPEGHQYIKTRHRVGYYFSP